MAQHNEPGTPPDPSAGGHAAPTSRRERRRRLVLGAVGLVVVLGALGLGLGSLARPGSGASPSGSGGPTASSPLGSGSGSGGPVGRVGPSASGSSPGGSGPPTTGGSGGPAPSVPPLVGPAAGFLVTSAELQQRAALAAQGQEPYREAVEDLLTFARDALVLEPHPEQPLDIPGTTGPFVDDTATAYGLALAYGVTGSAEDATQAAHDIMAWVDTTTTTVNACPDSGACQTSLIMSRAAPGFVFAATLIAPSGALSADDTARFKAWLRAIILPAASRLENNWGDAGTFTRLAVTAYLQDQEGFAAAVAKWRAQQDLIAADGHIPLEVRRESAGIGYTQEALDYKVAGAEIAARQGVDLWDYRGAGGATLEDAVDYLASYWFDPQAWPWYPDPSSPPLSGMWEIAYQHWPTPAWQPIIDQRRPYDAQGHSAVRWTTLTNGLPFDGSAGDPTPTP